MFKTNLAHSQKNEELDIQSTALRDEGVAHLFWIHNALDSEVRFWQKLDDVDAANVIVMLVEHHGGEILDLVIDRIIERSELQEMVH